MPLVARFELQFDPSMITRLAGRSEYQDDSGPLEAGRYARQRGFYTRDEFLTVCDWKTTRSRPRVAGSADDAVHAATRTALASNSDERERMEALTTLEGIGVPTASALLYFACPDDYPILDVRALESLGQRGRTVYSVGFWLQYLDACRDLAMTHSVPIRTLDKALWQCSKERVGSPPSGQ